MRFSGFTDEWVSYKIGDISKTYSGGTPSTSKREYYEGNIPFIKSGEIGNEVTEQYINEEAINNSSAKKVQKGDLLLALYGATSGEVAISKIDGAINQAVLKIDNKMNNYFQYNYFVKYKDQIIHKYLQGGQGNLSANIIKKLEFYYPNLEEQQKISNYLLLIDNKIELLEKKHHEYQNFKKYLMQQIFAQKLRFNINSSYSNYKLKDIVTKFSTGLNPRKNFKLNEGGENYYVTIKNFQNGKLNLDSKCDKINDNALKLINKRSDLQKDDLIFASIGRVGEVYLIKNNPKNWNINESVFSLRPDKRFILPKFLYYLLSSNKIQYYFKSNITGSTFKSIKMKDLKNTPVTIPDNIELQIEIIDFLTIIDLKIDNLKNELDNLIKFKSGLLQQMFIVQLILSLLQNKKHI